MFENAERVQRWPFLAIRLAGESMDRLAVSTRGRKLNRRDRAWDFEPLKKKTDILYTSFHRNALEDIREY